VVAGGRLIRFPPPPSRLFTPSYGDEKPPSVRRLLHTGEVQDRSLVRPPDIQRNLTASRRLCPESLWVQPGHRRSCTKLMQHWADRIDHWLDPKKVMPIKGGAQA